LARGCDDDDDNDDDVQTRYYFIVVDRKLAVAVVMKYSGVIRLLVLLLMMMITQLHSSEDTQSARFYSEDSELGDVQPFAVVLTPPSHALSPKVARLDAETAADAAAIRQEEAKTKQKLWRKAKQSADKHRQRQTQTDIKQEAQDNEKTESEKKKNGKRKMIPQKVNRHGNKKSQDLSTVNSYCYSLKCC